MTDLVKPTIPAEVPKPALVKVYDPDKAGKMPKADVETSVAIAAGETPEPPKAAVITPKPEEDSKKITARLAIAAKKEGQIKAREAELAKREEAIKSLDANFKSIDEAKKAAKINPIKFMEQFGLTFEEVTKFFLEGKPTEKSAMEVQKEEIEALKAELKKDKEDAQAREDKRQQEYIDRSIADYKTKLSGYIDSNPDEFELLIANGDEAKQAVWDVIQAHFDETGKTMDGAAAAKMVEEYYLEESKKYANTKKFKALAGIKTDPEKPKSVTLTNSGLVSAAASNANEVLSKEASLKKMAATLKWN